VNYAAVPEIGIPIPIAISIPICREPTRFTEDLQQLLVAGERPTNQANDSRYEKMKNCSTPNRSVNVFLPTTSNFLAITQLNCKQNIKEG